ncbi:bifunctional acetate--CoA ligase family protein/GNAT family N-acetyltransferase [Desulforhopalus sp. IMCC35007]|uniref:bifunctional acetate--CoA ligase family protein/GNAT family N-acetyltransferase n=1 Tax=Desulforhopalus sp. IMCC35007 TaxID=2569543 RepID=UPI0010AE74B9|nr:bifunctional acetate--CoA ligase family protein/GNAT family N-acetyltransferase [Desulforhopalus sp. IMCC35007]TKB07948.1 bifunctional acetate--CoA ligase family protein/GNAT family N-acetyltransferase [Desulforhopalus sp. IMCC35007]
MGQHKLNLIMQPRNITVIGATEKEGSIGSALMKNITEGGFTGGIYPVNPKYKKIHGHSCYKSVLDINTEIDLAVIATPIPTVPQIVQDCIDKKIGGAIIISAGGKEVGERGFEIEKQLIEIAKPSKFRIIGPNCLGTIVPKVHLNATFVSGMPLDGNMAFVSQSGAICSAILDHADLEGIGFSHFISIGSMIDVDFGDIVDYLGNNPYVKSILLYIESLTNFRKFMSAARAVSRVKPIIVLKAGRGQAGARAAASHTGAMAGEDAVYDAAFKRAGVVRVDTIEELFDCAEFMAKQPRPKGSRLAIITNGGGPGVMAADCVTQLGHEPTPLSTDLIKQLDSYLPRCWSHNNPIDLLGDATTERFHNAMHALLQSREFDGVLVVFAPQAIATPMAVANTILKLKKSTAVPIFACFMGGKSIQEALEYLNRSEIPTFTTPERAIRAYFRLVTFARNQELLFEVVPEIGGKSAINRLKGASIMDEQPAEGMLADVAVRALLSAYGLPVIRTETAKNEEDAVQMSNEIGYPVVLKLLSTDITHKTEANGVHLDLRSEAEVSLAFKTIMTSARAYNKDANIEGVTIQPYQTKPDYEILLGAKRDNDFGPIILFGLGGIFTEIIQDKALGLPPMNRLLARRLMQQTKAFTLLKGYRNRQAADLTMLEEMIVSLSQLLIDYPQISELDMNPVLISKGLPTVVDARVMVSPHPSSSPAHLVISPYPRENEYHLECNSHIHLFIRPVRPEDTSLFLNLFKVLSPTTIYFRFFGALKALSPEMLCRFTQIDYDREIALVAIDEDSTVDRILGVARIIGDPDGEEGEFAVLIGDAWQGQGIGASLLQKVLLIALKRNFKTIHGIVLQENTHMLALGKKLGFTVSRGKDAGEYQLHIDLSDPHIKEQIEKY